MGRAVLADDPCPVDSKDDRKVLDANIMDYFVVSSLQKGRIDSDNRPEPLTRQPGRKRNGMRFGDADIIEPVGEFFGKEIFGGNEFGYDGEHD